MLKNNSFFIWYLLLTSCASMSLFLGLTYAILSNAEIGIWQGLLCINLAAGNGMVFLSLVIHLFKGK